MRAFVLLLCSTLVVGAARAASIRPKLDGEWVGMRNGVAVTWQVGEDGRLRIDGRGADYEIHGDTLAVRFDSPAQTDTALRETAVYRFTPDAQATRLFVYGFDLGRQGVLLYRTQSEPPAPDTAPQDAAPPVPPMPPMPVPPSPAGPRSAPSEPHHPPH